MKIPPTLESSSLGGLAGWDGAFLLFRTESKIPASLHKALWGLAAHPPVSFPV